MAPKLTPEEKKAKKEAKKAQKALEAEMARRQVHLDHLSREVEFTRKNQKILNKEYRAELIKLKLDSMRQDAEAAWQRFDRIIDCKDFLISVMLDEVDAAQEQANNNFTAHAEAIDTLLLLLRNRVDDLRHEYLVELEETRSIDANEALRMNYKQFMDEEYFRQMLYQLEMEQKNFTKFSNTEHLNKLDLEDSKFGEILQMERIILEKKLETLWLSYKKVLQDYAERTEERKKEYVGLKLEDDRNTHIIHYQVNKLAALYDLIKKLKDKNLAVQENLNTRLDDLYRERQFFADAFWALRTRLKNEKVIDETQLAVLTEESNNVMQHLKLIYTKGEHLLNAASICRQLETQKEKVRPFYQWTESDTRSLMEQTLRTQSFNSPALSAAIEYQELARFWHRIGQADAQRITINEEREFLKRENRYLRRKLNYFCETAAFLNPYLSTVKERYVYPGAKKKLAPINTIEGCIVAKNAI